MSINEVVLASASPRRQELLKLVFDEFEVIPSNADESIKERVELEKQPEYLAFIKAKSVSEQYPDRLVIGCDTGVIADGQMLGKPADAAEAVRMLKLLSGKTHKVITGCCLRFQEKEYSFSEVTEVKFFELTDDEIADYILTNEWADKAGAYGIQGKAALFVEKIDGDYYNVVGLPCARLNRVYNWLKDKKIWRS